MSNAVQPHRCTGTFQTCHTLFHPRTYVRYAGLAQLQRKSRLDVRFVRRLYVSRRRCMLWEHRIRHLDSVSFSSVSRDCGLQVPHVTMAVALVNRQKQGYLWNAFHKDWLGFQGWLRDWLRDWLGSDRGSILWCGIDKGDWSRLDLRRPH